MAALGRYGILDTPPEAEFDCLATLIAEICEVPFALVSFVDAERQWFKARVGIEVTETRREISFCGHTLNAQDLFTVPDVALDERFAKNPLVTDEPGIRFYAGAPLRTAEGLALGALCVMDRVPRDLTAHQSMALQTLALQVVAQLELRKQLIQSGTGHTVTQDQVRFTEDIFDSLEFSLAVLDPTGRIVRVNSAWRRLAHENVFPQNGSGGMGADYLAPCEGQGQCCEDDVTDRANKGVLAVLQGHSRGFRLEYHCGGEGRPRWFMMQVSPLTGGQGAVITHQEITAARDSEGDAQRLAAIVEFSEDAILGKDLDGIVTSWNRGAEKVFGYTAGEMIGTSIMRLIPAERHEEENFILGAIRRGESVKHFETQRMTRDGAVIEVSITASPIKSSEGTITGVSKVARNITDRKRTEEALENNRRLLSDVIENSGSLVFVKDVEGRYQLVNKKWEEVTGCSRENVINRTDAEIFPGVDGKRFREVDLSIVSSGEVLTLEERLGEGLQARSFLVVKFPLRDAVGKVTGVCGMAADITGRKLAEAKVTEQAALLDKARDAILVRDLEHRITYWNKSAERLYGWTREQVLGQSIKDLLYRDSSAFLAATAVVLADGEWNGEIEQMTSEGRKLVVEGRWTLVHDVQGMASSILAINTDITERKSLERQFLRAQRLESIGTLAGGIAHDLNNVLGPILMSLELLRMRFPDRASLELLAIIKTSAQRGADMVRQVLSFARGLSGEKLEVQVAHLVGDIEKIVNETFLKHVQIRTIVPHSLWTVTGDATQLHQVLLNLCVNARDAMPNGGTLTISAENLVLDEHYAGMNIEASVGPYICLQVEDSGTGMPPEVMEKIFDPFFTTKEVGKGTGLGLSTTLAIVKSHGGFLRVYSEPGRGTKFKIYLPANTESCETSSEASDFELPRGNGELILVIDDEASVRQITERTLHAFGYSVALASDGAEAIAVFSQRQAEVAMVLTDMMMPVLDGPALIQVLQRLNPKLPIVAASGLSSNEHLARATSLGVKHFLPKPYTAETLLKTLRQVLTEARAK